MDRQPARAAQARRGTTPRSWGRRRGNMNATIRTTRSPTWCVDPPSRRRIGDCLRTGWPRRLQKRRRLMAEDSLPVIFEDGGENVDAALEAGGLRSRAAAVPYMITDYLCHRHFYWG